MQEKLLELLPASGAMEFAAWANAARAAGLRPDLWLRLKHAGVIETYIDDATGLLMVRRGGVS
jgi:hypothetical protein